MTATDARHQAAATDQRRRQWLTRLGALGCYGFSAPVHALLDQASPNPVDTRKASWLACAADQSGPFFRERDGRPVALPTRGHGIVPIPGATQAIVIARRPGTWLWRIDWRQQSVAARIEAPPARHFFGHAILSPDTRLLYTTENDIDTGAGVVGVYDRSTLARLGEFPSHGIGPHELLWLEPGRRLAVANGGILTLPETGRLKLNLDQMAPSVVVLDMPSGRLREEFVLDDRSLSLRHLARSDDGKLAIAIQAESPDGRDVGDAALLAILDRGKLRLAEQPAGLGGYAASVGAAGDYFVVTALQGDTVAVWHSSGELRHEIPMPRPAGVAIVGGDVLVSNEMGDIVHLDPSTGNSRHLFNLPGVRWDNHLIAVDI